MASIDRCASSVLGIVLAGLITAGCAPNRVVFQGPPVFPSARKAPLRLFLTTPVDSMDLGPVRDQLIRAAHDPSQAIRKVKCVWGPGLSDLVRTRAKATTLDSDVLADSPVLPPTATWLSYTSDVLSVPTFSVKDSAVLAPLARRGVDLVIVPVNLNLRSQPRARQVTYTTPGPDNITVLEMELFLETPVAVVNPNTNAIMWVGVVSSATRELAVGSTVLENEAYDWLMDLLAALNRSVAEPGTRSGERISYIDTICD